MGRREYQGAATPTTITSSITNSATSLTLTASTNWPTGVFSAVIDPGLAGEEKILCTSRSGTTVTITTRGYDGTTAASHNAGATIYPVPTAIDFDEANALINTPTTKGDILAATGAGAMARTAVGANTTVLTADSTQANGVKWASPSPATTKGDLVTYDTASARLPVGADGTTLVANSSASTGVSWATPVGSLANPVINGGMDIWQRGISFTHTGSSVIYSADRWGIYRSGFAAGLVSSQISAGSTLPQFKYAMRVQRTAGDTSTATTSLTNAFETINSLPYVNQTITLSFYARAGATFLAASNTFTAYVITGTGTDQNPWGGFTGYANAATSTVTLTTSWQRFAITGTVASTATQMSVYFATTPTVTAGASDYYDITGVQIDLGTYTATTAPAFRRSGSTIQGELDACQRYYYRQSANATNVYQRFTTYVPAFSATQVYCQIATPVTMRTTPTGLDYTTTGMTLSDAAGNFVNVTSIALDNSSAQNLCSVTATVASGLTTYRPYALLANNSATPYLGLSAEL